MNFNFKNHYNVEANNEFSNININTTNEFSLFKTENIKANIPKTFENQANLESLKQQKQQIFILSKKKKK